jgi:phosphoglycolate phosphatase
MKNKFDLIIFDWDGTLINSIDWIAGCIQRSAERCGFVTPDYQATKNVIGLSIERAMQTLLPEADEDTQNQLVTNYAEEYFSKQLSQEDFFPGVYDMLVQLQHTGYQLAVATGKTRDGLAQALHATNTKDLFSVTRCADETQSKPHPKMLQEIIEVTGIAPERALMVGDSIYDLQMALNAQISSVGVLCGANSEALLQQYNPLVCLSQPAELLNLI